MPLNIIISNDAFYSPYPLSSSSRTAAIQHRTLRCVIPFALYSQYRAVTRCAGRCQEVVDSGKRTKHEARGKIGLIEPPQELQRFSIGHTQQIAHLHLFNCPPVHLQIECNCVIANCSHPDDTFVRLYLRLLNTLAAL